MPKKATATEAKKPRGRPRFVPTGEMRDQIVWRRGAGWTERDCADEIGISVPTLEKHFAKELRRGKLIAKGRALDLLVKSANHGMVSAQKALAVLTSAIPPQVPARPPGEAKPGETATAATAPPVGNLALGKKAKAQMDAQTAGAGTAWEEDLIPENFRGRPN